MIMNRKIALSVILSLTAVSFNYAQDSKPSSSGSTSSSRGLKESKPAYRDLKAYRDLNKNGRLDDYENVNLPLDQRVKDLMKQMTVAEKAGEMFQTYTMIDNTGKISKQAYLTGGVTTDSLLIKKHINHFNLVGDASAKAIARYNNLVQKLAEDTRLGIPVTFSTDPRHSYKESDLSTAVAAGDFSAFPEPIGFGSIGNPAVMYDFGKLAASEYRAVGISVALHPMADLATDPRWSRLSGTFGEDAKLSSDLLAAYINGFQGNKLDKHSVACMTKHFPGNGPVKEGWESHFSYGRDLVYPGNNFDYHLSPFYTAIKAGTAGILTTYGISKGQTNEDVAASFNKSLLTDLLKKKMGFTGLIVSDWNTITDKYMGKMKIIEARSWGMDSASVETKLIREIAAGVDQIGGETETELLISLIHEGKIPMQVIDASVFKILKLKFQLGLFDNPYVDIDKVDALVGTPANRKKGLEAQQKSLVLLSNVQQFLPVPKGKKIYVEGFQHTEAFSGYGALVSNIEQCDVAIIHLKTPYGAPKSDSMLEKYFHQGDLSFPDSVKHKIIAKLKAKPVIVVMNLERAAVIPEIAQYAKALIADFGVSEAALLPMLFNKVQFSGKLPLELPSSMEAVSRQKEDLPHDSSKPLFKFGFGLKH